MKLKSPFILIGLLFVLWMLFFDSNSYLNHNRLSNDINQLQKDKIKHNKNFYVFTGSSVGVVPILGKGLYVGKINKLGKVSAKIN